MGGHPQDRVEGDTEGFARSYWDVDARTYDEWPEHGAWSAAERAAWTTVLAQAIEKPGARVLDVGAGTGFLSLAAARLGCEVTALDISKGMLSQLQRAAVREELEIRTVCGPATEPPVGPFDVVMERLAAWTLPDLDQALEAWRAAAPEGKLLVFEAQIGRDYVEGLRRRARELLWRRRRRGLTPEHHAPYPEEILAVLPNAGMPWPNGLIERVEAAGWHAVQVRRLTDVRWARELALPPLDRLLGATAEYLVEARARL